MILHNQRMVNWRGSRTVARSRVLVAGGAAALMTVSLAGTAVPAGSAPMSHPSSKPADLVEDGAFSPFTESSGPIVQSLGDGRAVYGPVPPRSSLRNPALRASKNLPSATEIEAAMRKALRGLVWTPKPDPVPDDVWRQIDEITAIAGAAPIIGRLPVDFNTYEVGRDYRERIKPDESLWKGAPFAHGSNDPKIAAASIKLFNAVSANSELAQRSIDTGLAFSAANAVEAGEGKPQPDGSLITGEQAFAQLGVTPFVSLMVTGSEAREMYKNGLLAGISLDGTQDLLLDETTQWIQADRFRRPQTTRRWTPSLVDATTGAGTTVAIIDSGVDLDHPAFQRNGTSIIVDGACFEDCDGQETESANVEEISAANHCSIAERTGCDHGTHVAGIVAGQSTSVPAGLRMPAGVAPGANVAAYRACSPGVDGADLVVNCQRSSMIEALGRTVTQAAANNIVAANLSILSPNSLATCPAADSLPSPAFASAVGAATAADISVVLGNGNGGRTAFASCDPTAIVVANVDKRGVAHESSDFHPDRTTLWAPGADIMSAEVSRLDGVDRPWVGSQTGTSMAAPHVSGSIALIAQATQGYNQRVPRAERTSTMQVRDLMLGIDPVDPGRVMITDDGFSRGSGQEAPLLSLRNLWMLLGDEPMSEQGRTPRYLMPRDGAVASQTPNRWAVTNEEVRREYDDGALPFSLPIGEFIGAGEIDPDGTRNYEIRRFEELTFLDGPYFTVHTKNGTVASAASFGGDPIAVQRIAKGPQPCTGSGWIETTRIPVRPVQAESGSIRINVTGPAPESLIIIEGTIASEDTFAVATDPRPLVFGGSTSLPEPVDLGAHRPDLSTQGTWINWFDLDRITGDELMINDALYAGSYETLLSTRIANDAVSQDFFVAPQTRRTSTGLPLDPERSGVIGWNEEEGVQDCAVALGHVWIGG